MPKGPEVSSKESRKSPEQDQAKQILDKLKAEGRLPEDWTAEEERLFVESAAKTMKSFGEMARAMEGLPQARVVVERWGKQPRLGWEWEDEADSEVDRKSLLDEMGGIVSDLEKRGITLEATASGKPRAKRSRAQARG